MPTPPSHRWRWTKIQRTTLFLVLGLAILGNEAFIKDTAQIELILAGLALLGFPNMLNANEALKRLLTVEEKENKKEST